MSETFQKPAGCEHSIVLAEAALALKPHKPDIRHARAHLEPVEPKDGIARTYAELVWLLREYRLSTGKPQLEIDYLSGMQEGYTGKLEQPGRIYGRVAVDLAFDLWIGGLRVGLEVVPL